MAKKFGKFLLGAAVIGGAAVAAYMYLQKKGVVLTTPENVDEDYDDFSEEAEESPSRNYVPLTKGTEDCATESCTAEECTAEECATEECCCEECPSEEPVFTETVSEEAAPVQEEAVVPNAVEEFFDEKSEEE